MSKYSRLLVLSAFAALGIWPADVAAQFDRSCNALQLVQQTTRMMRLPEGERYRYEGTINAFDREMNRLFDESRTEAREFDKVRNGHVERVIQARQDLVEKYQRLVLREQPDLTRAEAEQEIWVRLMSDPEFTMELQRRLIRDPSYDSIAAAVVRKQSGDYHELERRQHEALQKIPPPRAEYERKVAETAQALRQQNPAPRGSTPVGAGIGQSFAFQELLTTVSAGRIAARASLSQEGMDFAVAQSRLVFERPADPVVDVTESLKGAVRGIESLRLRATLNYQHAVHFLPAPSQRQAFLRNTGRELPRAIVEMVSNASQTRVKIREAARHLDTIEVPSPTPPAASSTRQTWMQTVVEKVKKTVKKVEYILEE